MRPLEGVEVGDLQRLDRFVLLQVWMVGEFLGLGVGLPRLGLLQPVTLDQHGKLPPAGGVDQVFLYALIFGKKEGRGIQV